MSRLPKRKCRNIVIDGKRFRWMLNRRRGVLHLVVQEEAERPGDPLVAAFEPIMPPSVDFDQFCKGSFTPGDVAKVIRTSLGQGWNPSASSKQVFTPKGEIVLQDYKTHVPKEPPQPRTFWDKLLGTDIV